MTPIVIETLSSERFDTYLVAAGHDQDRALRLYAWNAHVGGAFHPAIQAVEIALRNRINDALTSKFGTHWWRNSSFLALLDRERLADLDMVKRRIAKRGLSLVTGQIVAGLSFGFWTGLLQRRYNPVLWGAALRHAFAHLPENMDRDGLFRAAASVASLRNRISHHEPIIKRDLLKDFGTIMNLLKWICPATHDWIRPQCQVPEIVRAKP
jgi:hypothetical protein